MSFRLVSKSVTLNDLERRNGVILRYFSEFGIFRGALRKSSRSLSHLLMSSCYKCNGAFQPTVVTTVRLTIHCVSVSLYLPGALVYRGYTRKRIELVME